MTITVKVNLKDSWSILFAVLTLNKFLNKFHYRQDVKIFLIYVLQIYQDIF